MRTGSLPRKIGSVKIEHFLSVNDKEYSDGETESTLLDLFKSPDSEAKRLELLSKSPEWGILYHIAYTRENLLNWFDFGTNKTLLEVGAGCGALTGLFTRNCSHVDAVDISVRRSLINAYRNKDANNLNILMGNIENLKPENQYDYVTSIGVLEYSGTFISGKNPYMVFLSQLNRQLKKKGHLILAIENKFGIKYWAGASEDHTGVLFDSIEGFPADKGVHTFGKNELTIMLHESGYDHVEFYYPFPDYKMPADIYSDEYLPGEGGVLSSDLFPSSTLGQKRSYFFSEALAINQLSRNQLFSQFANSFLIIARKSA